jgi:hypothetical protein
MHTHSVEMLPLVDMAPVESVECRLSDGVAGRPSESLSSSLLRYGDRGGGGGDMTLGGRGGGSADGSNDVRGGGGSGPA